jgi:hypothetical protein
MILHIKIRWRNVKKIAGLAQENGLGSTLLHSLWWLVKGAAATLCTCRKEYDKHHLTDALCFWLAHHTDWSRWFAISSPPPICCPNFSFIGLVKKIIITKVGCEQYSCRVTYWARLEMLYGTHEAQLSYQGSTLVIYSLNPPASCFPLHR